MITRRNLLAGTASIAALGASVEAIAAPRAKLIDKHWLSFGDQTDVDHSEWTRLIGKWRRKGPDGVARLDYGSAVELLYKVGDYVGRLAKMEPTKLSRDAAFAYWANLYNATTVMLVLADYPVKSIKHVRGGLFSLGPWGEKVHRIEGRKLSLDDIEHGILRPIWRDPRVHYAVNCASIGCPNLPAAAWTAATLDADLDKAAREFVNHPRAARVEKGRLHVSSIYVWFQKDFGGDDAGVIKHLRRYAKPELASALAGVKSIYRDHYDWALNDSRR